MTYIKVGMPAAGENFLGCHILKSILSQWLYYSVYGAFSQCPNHRRFEFKMLALFILTLSISCI